MLRIYLKDQFTRAQLILQDYYDETGIKRSVETFTRRQSRVNCFDKTQDSRIVLVYRM